MGCANSSAAGNKTAPAKLSPFDARVAKNLERLKVEYDASKNKVTSFDQIILKFPKINASFTKVKAMFETCDDDGNGTLDYDEIKPFLAKLGTDSMTDEEISTVFQEADMYANKNLTHKEFLVCLAVGYVLGDIKVGSGSELGPELKQAFDWVLGAYLVFDVKHTGILDKEEVLKQMQAKEGAFKSAGAASVLSAERWKEMDWDDDGTITFKEFFWAFQGWISAEDEDA